MKRSLQRVENLHGIVHGSINPRLPGQMVVPVHADDRPLIKSLPHYTQKEADALGLITDREIGELFGWSKAKVRYRREFAANNKLVPVGCLLHDTRGGLCYLYKYTDVEAQS